MRLGISKSKNTINYYIIKDYTKNGKRSTKHVLRIGNIEEIKQMAGNLNYKEWLKQYVDKFNEENKKNSEIIQIQKNNLFYIYHFYHFTCLPALLQCPPS